MIIIKYKQKINYLYIKVIYKQKFYYKDIGLNIKGEKKIFIC